MSQRWASAALWAAFLLVLIAGAAPRAMAQTPVADGAPPQGRFVSPGPAGPIGHDPALHPMFAHWFYCLGRPVVARFEASPDTRYQVFIGLTEDYWDRAGQRIVDLEVGGSVVATVDTFKGSKGTAHGYLLPATTDATGGLLVRVCPHAGSPDQSPIVCGVLLFAGDVKVDADSIVHNRGPEPLVTLLAAGEMKKMDQLLANRGSFFAKKRYEPEPLPTFKDTKALLPSPIYDEDADAVRCYWKAWELAFDHFRKPAPGSPFVSNYIDENFNESLFLWDTAFMTMFCNYAHPYVPGIRSLDNFYCTQLSDGEIVREVSEITGVPHPASRPGTADSLNHPILAWAERESYRISADRARLEMVYEPLKHYYRSYEKIRDEASGFYAGSWASMDNSPRLDGGKLACGIDTTAEVVLFARDLAYIASQIGRDDESAVFEAEASALSVKINRRLWDESSGFYYDLAVGGTRHDARTIAGFWTLLAGVASPVQADRLVAHLNNPAQYNRPHRVPTAPGDQAGYHADGHYWRGGVWTPTDLMVVRGLERYGQTGLARDIALNHLGNVVRVFQETGTIWEYYAPDAIRPGEGPTARRDFVGWSGIAPIVCLIEHAIGIRADAPSNTITWDIRGRGRMGVERLWFGGTTVSLVCEAADGTGARAVRVTTDRAFRLVVVWNSKRLERKIEPGRAETIALGP